jgi:PST family polysaccharide transporter
LPTLWRFDIALLSGFLVLCGAVYALRNVLLAATYSERFLPAADFVLPQLAGDALRVAALSISYYFISQGRLVIATGAELGRGVALYVFYFMLIADYGAAAPLYAHVATYAVFLVAMLSLLLLAPAAKPRQAAIAPPPAVGEN